MFDYHMLDFAEIFAKSLPGHVVNLSSGWRYFFDAGFMWKAWVVMRPQVEMFFVQLVWHLAP